MSVFDSPGYHMIKEFYGERRTARSGVPLINHIDQGIEILRRIGSDDVVMEAFAVHPIFQADDDLKANFYQCDDLHPLITLYAIEYRNIANSFLSYKVSKEVSPARIWDNELHSFVHTDSTVMLRLKHPIKLSPLNPVNEMLIADKVQNRKDFDRYHKGTHARSAELEYYFANWLEILGISEEKYQELITGL